LMVEPGDPFQRCQFEGFAGFPGRTAVDEFGLVQPIDGLGQGIIVAVAAHSDGYSPRCSCTKRTARSRTSGENLFYGVLFIAPFSQDLEPPQNPRRFTMADWSGIGCLATTSGQKSRITMYLGCSVFGWSKCLGKRRCVESPTESTPLHQAGRMSDKAYYGWQCNAYTI